jgi:hypothetical protein
MASGLLWAFDMRRMRLMTPLCSSMLPWEKFSRATSIPARTISSRTPELELAGPIVHTIFVFLISLTDAIATASYLKEDFE